MKDDILYQHYVSHEVVELRQLQEKAFQLALYYYRQGKPCWTLDAPPSFGKTIVSLTVMGHLLTKGLTLFDKTKREFKGAIVIVPTNSIIQNFHGTNLIEVPGGLGPQAHRPYRLDVAKLIHRTTPSRRAIVELFDKGGIAIMTDKMLYEHKVVIPTDLTEFMLYIDEAHHAPLAESQILTYCTLLKEMFLDRGALGGQTTATPWHTASGKRIYVLGEAVTTVGLGELRSCGLAPNHVEIHRIMLDFDAEDIKEWMFVDIKTNLLAAYRTLVQFWVDQGRPYFGIRPPDLRHVEAIKQAFAEVGADLLDLTGKMTPEKNNDLVHERHVTDYKKRKYSGIIACRRLDEGVDVPLISNVYYIGAPNSVRQIIQFFGRTLRVKSQIKNYPKKWSDRVAFTCFIPRGNEPAEEYLREHGWASMLVAAYLEDNEVGEFMISTIGGRLRKTFSVYERSDVRSLRREAIIQEVLGDDISRAEAKVELHKMIMRHIEPGVPVVQATAILVGQKILDIADPRVRTPVIGAFYERFRETHPKEAEEIWDLYHKEIHDAENDDSNDPHRIHLSIWTGFRHVVEKFSSCHKIVPSKAMLHLMSKFTGLQLEKIAKILRRLTMSKPTPHEYIRGIHSYANRTNGNFPTKHSGSAELDGMPGYQWSALITMYPQMGFRESSWTEFCKSIGGYSTRSQRNRRRRAP